MEELKHILRKYECMPHFDGIKLVSADQKGIDEQSPLHIACYNGSYDDVVVMLKSDVDINVRGDIGCTPLHEAVSNGHEEVVKLLLDHGAITSIKNDYGDTPVDFAEIEAFDNILVMLNEKGG